MTAGEPTPDEGEASAHVTAVWHVETTETFDRALRALDRAVQRRVVIYLQALENLDDPRSRGKGGRNCSMFRV